MERESQIILKKLLILDEISKSDKKNILLLTHSGFIKTLFFLTKEVEKS